jgi:hypothetical protein
MAINKTTTETKNKIKANSVIALPNRPQIPAEQLKQAFVKPIVDTSNSMIQELDRIVEETNAELEQVQVDITDAIDEHNTDTEATHLDIRQEITDLENDLQEQIDGIDDTLQNHESRIGELELFAENLETNITEEIEGALENKADLVDGKVPLEQLPDVEDVLTGDITSHNHATEIGNHNSSETAHTNIRNAVAEAKAIAEGKSRARVFATKSELDTWLLDSENVALLQIGDNFYIEETDKPDYWWNGTTIKELETQKVDLTEYAKKTDIPDITVNNGSAESGKYISQIAVDATDKHKLIVTKADLPQGFSGDYNDLTNKPTIPTLSHDISTDIADTTKAVTPNAVGNYTYSRSAIDAMFDNLLGGEY